MRGPTLFARRWDDERSERGWVGDQPQQYPTHDSHVKLAAAFNLVGDEVTSPIGNGLLTSSPTMREFQLAIRLAAAGFAARNTAAVRRQRLFTRIRPRPRSVVVQFEERVVESGIWAAISEGHIADAVLGEDTKAALLFEIAEC